MTRALILLALGLAAPAFAQMPDGMVMPAANAACPKPEVVVGFEAWGKGTPAPQLKAGHFAELALAPAEAVKFSPPLNRAPAPGSKGGVYAFSAEKTATYRFALGAGAWIDVIGSKGQRLPSAEHAHGTPCSGITKIVDYVLESGDYVVQLSASNDPKIKVLVIGPVPPL